MKKIKILFLISALAVTYFSTVKGQVRVNFNINLQPQWAPASYDHAEYYFLPELGIYYSVPTHEFIYPDGNRWMFSRELPPEYHRFDLYSTYKVIINDPKPYLRNNYYVMHYRGYQNNYQENRRYFGSEDNGRHKDWEHNGDARYNNEGYRHGHGHDHAEQRGRGHDRD